MWKMRPVLLAWSQPLWRRTRHARHWAGRRRRTATGWRWSHGPAARVVTRSRGPSSHSCAHSLRSVFNSLMLEHANTAARNCIVTGWLIHWPLTAGLLSHRHKVELWSCPYSLFVCLSVRHTDGGGGFLHRPFGPHWLVNPLRVQRQL